MTGKLTWIRNSPWMNTTGRISFRELCSIFFPISRKAQHKMTTNLLEWKVECKLYDRRKHVNLANVMSCATLHWLKCLQSITSLVWALLHVQAQLWLDLMSMPVQSALKHSYSILRVHLKAESSILLNPIPWACQFLTPLKYKIGVFISQCGCFGRGFFAATTWSFLQEIKPPPQHRCQKVKFQSALFHQCS